MRRIECDELSCDELIGHRYRRDLNIHTASIVKIGNTMSHPTKSIAQPNLDKSDSLYDVLKAFAVNKGKKIGN